MPLSHKKRSVFYRTLAQQLEAGLPLAAALRAAAGSGAAAVSLEAMAQTLDLGGTVDDALTLAAGWLSLDDARFLSAAAQTGRLPRVLHALATRHEQLSSVKKRLMLACLYPAVLLHLGLLLFPLLGMIDWEKGFQWAPAAYVRTLGLTLAPLWIVAGSLLFLSARQSRVLHNFAQFLPVFRGYVRAQALADFSFALGNFLDAGLRIDHAWQAAGAVSRWPALQAAARTLETVIAHGEAPGAQLSRFSCFPSDFCALYRTGESAGQLEQNLLMLAAHHQERADRALKLASLVYPGLLLGLTLAFVAYHVIRFYAGYFRMIESLAAP
jgi:general secretion pathway protein F/type IV pilus assembly protein PilC